MESHQSGDLLSQERGEERRKGREGRKKGKSMGSGVARLERGSILQKKKKKARLLQGELAKVFFPEKGKKMKKRKRKKSH